jgi:hypothetical protein
VKDPHETRAATTAPATGKTDSFFRLICLIGQTTIIGGSWRESLRNECGVPESHGIQC